MKDWLLKKKWRIFLVGMLGMSLPLLGLAVYAYLSLARGLEEMVTKVCEQTARVFSHEIELRLDSDIIFGKAYATRPMLIAALQQGDKREMDLHLQDLIRNTESLERVFITSPRGIMLANIPEDPKVLGRDFSFRDWHKGVSQDWSPYVSEFFCREAHPQRHLFNIAVPIKTREGKVLGILVLQPKDTYFKNAFALAKKEAGPGRGLEINYAYVVDKNGSLVFRPNRPLEEIVDLSAHSVVCKVIKGLSGVEKNPALEDTEIVITAYHPVEPWNWGVIVEWPLREILSPVNTVVWGLFLATGLMLALGAVFACLGGELLNSTQRLTKELQETNQEMQSKQVKLTEFNNALQQEMGERKIKEVKIRELNQGLNERLMEITEKKIQLEATNKELESFSYAVSHDLRAPLRIIDGFSQALLEDCRGQLTPQGEEYLGRILRNTQRMEELIDCLLALSRLTQTEMRRQKVDLGKIAWELTDNLREADSQRQVEVIITPGLEAEGDPSMLRVMLENLLNNAWKFTGKKAETRIEIGAQPRDNGSRVFYVKDNGAGFDMEFADKLFGAFQRLHGQDEFPGIGIGLATVQRIINRHGGRVWAEGAVDQGAVIYFTLTPEGLK